MAELSWKNEPYFSFEANFDDEFWIGWCYDTWYSTFIIAAVYVMLIYPARQIMESRPAFKLRLLLVVWNLVLGVFSIVGTARSMPVIINAVRREGFYSTMCESPYFTKDYVGIWGILFILSKVPELGDTAFIILRKQKLIFLHWYHHASTLIFAWRLYSTRSSVAFTFCLMNYFVHSLMYSYYAIRAAGVKINRKIAMCITMLQLSQMFMGMFAVLYAVYHKLNGQGCSTGMFELGFGIAIYTSYMILFAHFFYNAYIKKKKPRDAVADDSSRNGTTMGKGSEVNGNSGHVVHSKTSQSTNGVRRRGMEGGDN